MTNRFIIKRLSLAFVVWLMALTAVVGQTKVEGVVVAQEDNEPVIGATVMVEGEKTGTTTDLDGHFTIEVPAGKKLVISYVGMTTQTLVPKSQMQVVLVSDAIMVEEVVVTGMQKMDKRLFTGSSTKSARRMRKSTVSLMPAVPLKAVLPV